MTVSLAVSPLPCLGAACWPEVAPGPCGAGRNFVTEAPVSWEAHPGRGGHRSRAALLQPLDGAPGRGAAGRGRGARSFLSSRSPRRKRPWRAARKTAPT